MRARAWKRVLGGVLLGLAGLATPSWAQTEAPAFDLDIDAPESLRDFLWRHVELQRFRTSPDLSRSELERLAAEAHTNIRELLGTQGYFSPSIDVTLQDRADTAPRVQIHVQPGEAVTVALTQITLEGAAQDAPEAADQRQRLMRDWSLPVGQTFSQSAWDTAKSRALRTFTERRYPRATVANSLADIVPDERAAHLYVVIDSGPAYVFGDIQVEGASRYDPEIARRLVRLAGLRPGEPYDESVLQAAQQRLTESGYYPSAFVQLAPTGDPDHHKVQVRVREAPLQKVVIGVGGSTDRGPRLTLEHTHHRVPSIDWRAVSRLQAERDTTTLGVDLSAPVDERGWRWITAGEWQRQEDGPRITHSQQIRLGQAQDMPALDRSLFLQWDRSSERSRTLATGAEVATSVSANYVWTRRRFDDLTSPRAGHGLSVELGAGLTLSQTQRPYVRARVRWLGYRPIGTESDRPSRWALRLEGGAISAQRGTPVPATQRFLAGGDNSVRGYALNDIGVPAVGGGVEAGLWLAVASLEWQRPLWVNGQRSPWEAVVFVDSGAVANRASDLTPQTGVGAGVRYNSPVGPLQADLAYGLDRKRLRLHLSVGFTF